MVVFPQSAARVFTFIEKICGIAWTQRIWQTGAVLGDPMEPGSAKPSVFNNSGGSDFRLCE